MWNSAVEHARFLQRPFKNRPFFRLLGVKLPIFRLPESSDVRAAARNPTVLKLKALLPLKQQAEFGEFLLRQQPQAEFGKFGMRQGAQAQFADFLGRQKRFSMLSNKDVLLLLHTEAERPNYPGNAYAKVGGNPWLLILKDSGASARLLGNDTAD